MTDWIIWITGCGLALWAAIQYLFVLAFAVRLRRWQPQDAPEGDCARVAVVLSLRGNDPYLGETIRGLLNQEYPNYCLRFVVDHSEDPAAQIVDSTLAGLESSAVAVRPLANRSDSCSLLCSSLVQAVSELDDDIDVVAFVDADVRPDPRWLTDLVLPLRDPGVPVTMGNRWFMPADDNWGSSLRYIFNAVAVLHMYWCELIWGGSMAIRRDVLERSDLVIKWKRALFHDSPVYSAINECGFKPVFVPGVMMVNRESCELIPFFNWMKRQLLNTWLYHPNWQKVAFHLSFGIALLTTALVGICITFSMGCWGVMCKFVAIVVLYAFAFTVMLGIAEAAVRSVVRRRDEKPGWLSTTKFLRIMWSLPLAAFMGGFALASVPFTRRVHWRGVSYELLSAWNVRMVEYKAFRAEASGSVASLQ